jgi:hypothetical protein
VTQLVEVLDNRIILQLEDTEQSFCANKGYTGDPAKKIVEAHGYITHVKGRGEEIKAKKECPVIVLAGGSLN